MEFKLPNLGENIVGGTVVKIMVTPGQKVEKDTPLLEVETEKAVVEVPSPGSHVVEGIKVSVGQKIKVGDVLLVLKGEDSQASAAPAPAAPVAQTQAPSPSAVVPTPQKTQGKKGSSSASPGVRSLARELGIDLNEVEGSGPGGRITKEDLESFKGAFQESTQVFPAPSGNKSTLIEEPILPDFTKWGEVSLQPMEGIREVTARNVGLSWRLIPHVTQHDVADITQVNLRRKRYAERVAAQGGKLTVTAMMLKVLASALKVFPQFNASIDSKNNQIIFKKYCHIGVAVDTEHGLIVPSIRNVDQKNIVEISKDLNAIAERARKRKVSLDELYGSSFTVTNLGGIGGSFFTPIIRHPEVAILGMGKAREVPVFKDGKWEPRLELPLSLSYDHRLIDGADAVRFLNWIITAFEEPFLMELEG